MELPQIKMKKKSNVKKPTSIIPSLKTLKITLSNHRANPQNSLKWRSLQKNKNRNKKLQRSLPSVPSKKTVLSKKVSRTSFKCALRREKKGL
jgi:hypothetical protein